MNHRHRFSGLWKLLELNKTSWVDWAAEPFQSKEVKNHKNASTTSSSFLRASHAYLYLYFIPKPSILPIQAKYIYNVYCEEVP